MVFRPNIWHNANAMSVRMRTTKGKRNSRRANHRVAVPPYARGKDEEAKEGAPVRIRHHASRITGMYRNRSAVDMSGKREKIEQKRNRAEQESKEDRTVERAEIPNAA